MRFALARKLCYSYALLHMNNCLNLLTFNETTTSKHMHNTAIKQIKLPCNTYGVHPYELTFGVCCEFLAWPSPILQPMIGRLLTYNEDTDVLTLITDDSEIVTSRFSLVMGVH